MQEGERKTLNLEITRSTGVNRPYVAAVGSKGSEQGFSQSFQQEMNNQEKRKYQEQLEEIFQEITENAQEILKRADLTQFEVYRKKISGLMREILQHAYLFQPEKVRDGSGHQRVYAMVTVVDERLEQMGNELIAQNGAQLDLISRVDEIRGLIMDLFM